MSQENLFASVELEDKILYVYGYVPALELKKIAEDFRNGVEVKHPQVKIENKRKR